MLKWLLNVLWPKKPEIWQWCFRCKKNTVNSHRKTVWYGKLVDLPHCRVCGARKWYPNKK